MENAEIVKIGKTPAEMIMYAVSNGTDLVQLEKLMELNERWEKNEARKEFARAFSTAQANILPVIKKKFNKQTQSKYSDLADVIETTQPIYTKEGFSVTFNEGECFRENHARVLAEVQHCSGHKEQYHLDVPLDGAGIKGNANMTPIHGKASTIVYGRRYLMCMIWNIPTQDTDGNTTNQVTIDEKQIKSLKELLAYKDLSEAKLLEFMKVEKVEDIKSSEYMKALAAINSAKKKAT